ncbi:MAG TPA: uracil-DNA glycosylase [Longimicrobiales bacterium]|nr:uracil-DNA glycosylase [Longimicrobiales bacterium]
MARGHGSGRLTASPRAGDGTDPAAHAGSPDDAADAADDIAGLDARVVECRACPRLVEWREHVAREKRKAFEDEEYWGRPVPGFGPGDARLLIVGLAPAAHGANRTGRMFTGDRSGDWLFAALHRAGFATQAEATARDDGLELLDCRVTSAVKCAPPDNRPTPDERKACAPFLMREIELLLPSLRCIVALGGFGWTNTIRMLDRIGFDVPVPRPKFGHDEEVVLSPDPDASRPPPRALPLVGSYHPSQQNTFTGRLTEEMFDAVWRRARAHIG